MKKKVLTAVFFASWLLTGCSIETFFESRCNATVTIIAACVAIASAWAISRK